MESTNEIYLTITTAASQKECDEMLRKVEQAHRVGELNMVQFIRLADAVTERRQELNQRGIKI